MICQIILIAVVLIIILTIDDIRIAMLREDYNKLFEDNEI